MEIKRDIQRRILLKEQAILNLPEEIEQLKKLLETLKREST